MTEYIIKDMIFDNSNIINVHTKEFGNIDVIPIEYIMELPTEEVVSKKVFDQVEWERNEAFKTLKSIGLSLGIDVNKIEKQNKYKKSDFISRRKIIDDLTTLSLILSFVKSQEDFDLGIEKIFEIAKLAGGENGTKELTVRLKEILKDMEYNNKNVEN